MSHAVPDNPVTIIFTGKATSAGSFSAELARLWTSYHGQNLTPHGHQDFSAESSDGGRTWTTVFTKGYKNEGQGHGASRCALHGGDLAGIRELTALSHDRLPYSAPSRTDWCDFHIRVYGPFRDPGGAGYFAFATTHIDWNDTDPCTQRGNLSCRFPRMYGWQEDAAGYVDQWFAAKTRLGVKVTRHWVRTGCGSRGTAGCPTHRVVAPTHDTCHSPAVTLADGRRLRMPGDAGTPGQLSVGPPGDGTNSSIATIYCEQSDGWVDRIDLGHIQG